MAGVMFEPPATIGYSETQTAGLQLYRVPQAMMSGWEPTGQF
jgi:hypothetical protein